MCVYIHIYNVCIYTCLYYNVDAVVAVYLYCKYIHMVA